MLIRLTSLFGLAALWVFAAWLTDDAQTLPMPQSLLAPFWHEPPRAPCPIIWAKR